VHDTSCLPALWVAPLTGKPVSRLTIDQLAERLGVTERYVRRLVAERRVPYRKLGKLIRFADHEIAEWLDTTRRPQGGHDRSA
jgi:excisionase family DNA binding protein